MELFTFQNIGAYEKAMLCQYKAATHFINNKSGVLHIVCNPGGAFFRNTCQRMIGVKSNDVILCQCILIKHKNFDALMVAFFEAVENATDAVGMMMTHASEFAKSVGTNRIIVAMDGHCNYSIGFSCGMYNRNPLFGESRNADYYNDYFQSDWIKRGLSCYAGDLDDIIHKTQALAIRMEKHTSAIKTQCINLKYFKREIVRYTDLSNRIFNDHWYYFHREYNEDYELFKSMKPLLSPCNLIFAVKDGEDIGYMVQYPDFNQLVTSGGAVGVKTYLRHKWLSANPNVIKIAEIAVLPAYHSTGVILALLSEASKQGKQRYPELNYLVSSWIANDNQTSTRITKRFAPNLYGSYSVYEKEI